VVQIEQLHPQVYASGVDCFAQPIVVARFVPYGFIAAILIHAVLAGFRFACHPKLTLGPILDALDVEIALIPRSVGTATKTMKMCCNLPT
jgi:hypothetical protein